MDIRDIIEIFILAAMIFFPAGYVLRNRLPRWKNRFAAFFLSPRYLTRITASSVSKSRKRSGIPADASAATGKSKTSL
ncbi:cellulose biosynthesis protein BcsF [Rahnella perminowiae]|uniref:cellulose biosynthesis protein BcsF n=1 Tax=Rahnella perminowiae TaxID=2816244 RepID=UPI00224AEA83|nr:cellulose biosynthesis protein BcsF [Rahnella perminowiae]MCX2946144.1 cellulose biosynthesis protein BcsF [Rahnella perminowiae]